MEIEELLQHPRRVWNVGKEQGLRLEWEISWEVSEDEEGEVRTSIGCSSYAPNGKRIGIEIPMSVSLLSTYVDCEEFPEELISVLTSAELNWLKKI